MRASQPSRNRSNFEVDESPAVTQALAEALSRAMSAEEVAEAVFRHLLPATGAAAGTLVLLTDDGKALEAVGAVGFSDASLRSLAGSASRFPDLAIHPSDHKALAVFPLPLEDATAGALVLAYTDERSFSDEERAHLMGVSTQCAVALQRAAAFAIERANRERLEVALQAARMGTWDWDVRANRVVWSPQLEAIHGFSPGAFGSTLRAYFAHVHPDDVEQVSAGIQNSLEEGALQINYRAVWPNGELHWYEARGLVVHDASRRPIALRGVCMDVTQRHQVEQAVRESEERFRVLANNIAQLAWMADPSGERFWFNQRWYDYTGTSFDEVRGWGWTTVHHPDHLERVVERLKRAWHNGEPWEDTCPLRGRNGQYRWFLSRAQPIHDQSGAIVRWIGTNTDITEQRWTEALLTGERNALEMIAQGSPIGTVLADLCHTVEQLAEDGLLASILLLDEDGTHLRHGAAPGLPDEYNRGIDGVAIGPSVGSCGTAAFRGEQVVVADIATDPLWADYRELAIAHGLRACWSTPLKGADGRVLGTFALYYREPRSPTEEHLLLAALVGRTAATIIERKQAEVERARLYQSEYAARAAAEEAITARDEFVAVVAHDLRNPLTAVKGHIQMVRRRVSRGEVPTAQQLIERLDTIDSSVSALAGQIDELHDATLLQARRPLELQRRATDLVAVTRESVANHQHVSDALQLRFASSLAELHATCDAVRIERVLANLLSNAIKYSPSGGEVVVQVSRDEQCALISVQDHGIGIPAADLPRVFERFRRASNVAGRIAGSGLGLAGAREIVEQHGGTITVESQEGQGSTFTIRLPL